MTTAKSEVKKSEQHLPGSSTLDDLMRQDAGRGISNRAEDNLIAGIKVLQPLSPQVLTGPGHVEGAKPGDFLVDAIALDGAAGFWFQPAEWKQMWMEFIPRERGGGFVASYPYFEYARDPQTSEYLRDKLGRLIPERILLPEGVQQVGQFHWKFKSSGNECTHYRQLAGLMWKDGIGLEYTINFSSTGHTIARQWNTIELRQRFPDGTPKPAYAFIYHVTTAQRRNAQGQWYVIDVGAPVRIDETPHIPDWQTAYAMGQALCDSFGSGEKVGEVVVEESYSDERM